MAQALTSDLIKSLSPPSTGSKIYYDSAVKGFGVRITASGARAFILNYRTRTGHERRYTLGPVPGVKVAAALNAAADTAREFKRRIRDEGFDPVGLIEAERSAKTINDLCDRFMEEHVNPKRSPATRLGYQAAIDRVIRPHWGKRKVKDINFEDVDKLHRDVTANGTRKGSGGAPYVANRTVAMLSKMFNLAIRWKWRPPGDNPTRGIERNSESKRRRYLSAPELEALVKTLAERDRVPVRPVPGKQGTRVRRRDLTANNIVRLLLLTGARSGETMAMTWGEVDLSKGVWTKPSAHTKQKEEHGVPLSAPTRLLLTTMRDALPKPPKDCDPVFVGHGSETAQTTMKKSWTAIRQRATVLLLEMDGDSDAAELIGKLRVSLGREPTLRQIEGAAAAANVTVPIGLRDLRIHDLRHSYASFLVSEGLSLATIGALLGHTQPSTTARYAHLFDDVQRKATERVGQIVQGAQLRSVAS